MPRVALNLIEALQACPPDDRTICDTACRAEAAVKAQRGAVGGGVESILNVAALDQIRSRHSQNAGPCSKGMSRAVGAEAPNFTGFADVPDVTTDGEATARLGLATLLSADTDAEVIRIRALIS